MTSLQPSNACIKLIQQFEGFRAKPYLCSAGVPTIGYGSTRYADGRAVSLSDAPISQDEAQILLLMTIGNMAASVNSVVNVPLKQYQFDALVAFVYNIGATNFAKSTMLKKLNAGQTIAAAEEFLRWAYVKGTLSEGLMRRRRAEQALFLGR